MSHSLQTLIKLQKTRVEEQQQILARLQNHLDRVQASIVALEESYAREQKEVSEHPEYGQTYGAYVSHALSQARELAKSRETAIAAVEIARDQLAVLFEEQKRYEIALAAREAEAEKQEGRRERIEMDEIGSVDFARKHKDSA